MERYRAGFVLLPLAALVTFIMLAQGTTPLWVFAAVTCLWTMSMWSLWQSGKGVRQGLSVRFGEAAERGEDAVRKEARNQVKLRLEVLAWTIALAATAAGAFLLTVHMTS